MAWQKITDEYGGTYYVDETTGAYSATKPAGFQDQSVYWTDPGPAPQPGWSYDNAAGQYIQPQDVAAYKQANPNANITEVQAQMPNGGGIGDLIESMIVPALMAGVGGLAFSGAGLGAGANALGGASTGALDLAALGPVSYGAPAAAGAGAGGMTLNSPASWLDPGFSYNPLDSFGGSYTGVSPNVAGSTMLNSAGGAVPINWAAEAGLSGAGGASSVLQNVASAAGNAGGSSGGTAPTGTGTAASGTALSKILNGTATADDWLGVLGKAAPGLISAFGSSQQGDQLMQIAEQSRADRAPFLAKANEWLANPQGYAEGPGASVLNGVLRKLSATHGNPIDSPTALGIATDVGLNDWRNAVTGMGNIGLSGSDSRAALQTNAINTGSVWPGLGDAAASVFGDGHDELTKLLSKLQGSGSNSFSLR